MTDEPKIYVACLAAYNNGYLHGKWIDLTQELEDVWSEIHAMLKASPISDAEEWAVHDYEGFETFNLSEYVGIEQAHQYAEFIYDHGRIAGMLLSHFSGNLDEAERAMENHAGEYRTLGEFAEEFTEQSIDIPESLQYYIDYE